MTSRAVLHAGFFVPETYPDSAHSDSVWGYTYEANPVERRARGELDLLIWLAERDPDPDRQLALGIAKGTRRG